MNINDDRVDQKQDKLWLALMESLAAHTALLRFVAGDNNIDKSEAMSISAAAIKRITETFDEFNL